MKIHTGNVQGFEQKKLLDDGHKTCGLTTLGEDITRQLWMEKDNLCLSYILKKPYCYVYYLQLCLYH